MTDDRQTPSEIAIQAGVLSLMQFKSDLYGDRTAFHFYEHGIWKETTYSELDRDVTRVSDYLISQCIVRGDRIAILSESRPEWSVAFFASIRCGAVVVPIDVKLTESELATILADSEPRIIFVSSKLLDTARRLRKDADWELSLIVLDKLEPGDDCRAMAALESQNTLDGVERDYDETALIVYTSGTTGTPKGVMVTFRNLAYQVMNFECVMKLTSRDVLLSMLPMNHLLELTCGLLGVLYAGGSICYCETLFPQEIADIMRTKKVTAMITVPLFMKMLKAAIEREIQKSGPVSRRLFAIAFRVVPRRGFRFVKKLLFRRIHKRFGNRLKNFITGGASLEPEVLEFFARIGAPIYLGYGLTETSPVVSVNTPKANRAGSVGRPLAGVRVRIQNDENHPDGEILTAGPHVMKGYYRQPDLTASVIDPHGWFHTGDLGRIDEDGFLYITGRIKNVIILSSGKKVNPDEVEAVISKSELIKEVCVVGAISSDGLTAGTEEVCAIIVPIEKVVRESEDIDEAIGAEVRRLYNELAPYKRPSRICVRLEDLPKTTTRKVKRAVLLEWLAKQDLVPAQSNLPG